MIKPVYFAKLVNWTAAVILIVITTVIGYVLVFVGAVVWNRCIGKSLIVRGRGFLCALQSAE